MRWRQGCCLSMYAGYVSSILLPYFYLFIHTQIQKKLITTINITFYLTTITLHVTFYVTLVYNNKIFKNTSLSCHSTLTTSPSNSITSPLT